MLCNQCRKEVPAEGAIWTQDFNARVIAFCSRACREIWTHGEFSPRSDRQKESAMSKAIYMPAAGPN